MISGRREIGEIAYFTMEVGLESDMHTYSGGLGVLAGDTLRSFADLGVPAVGVTLLNKEGYCSQSLDGQGRQTDTSDEWNPEDFLERLSTTAAVEIEGEEVSIGVWKREVESTEGSFVPIFFLDTDMESNEEKFRDVTSSLYGGDDRYRLSQEIVLGIGGVRILDELGYQVEKYHLNESHSSLLALELLKRNDMNPDSVRDQCVFTTHTPVASAHDKFPYDLVEEVLGDYVSIETLKELSQEDGLHMTVLALNLSGYVNAVSKRHGEVSQEMFPEYSIDSITNGIHTEKWVSEAFGKIYDDQLPGWRRDPYKLKHAVRIPKEEIWQAHLSEKEKLIGAVNENTDVEMNSMVFTIGFARRAAPYKRADLFFYDTDRLIRMAKESGDFQVLFAGKAHPRGDKSKEMIEKVTSHIRELGDDIKMAYLEDYDMKWGALLTSGVDLWLNTPERGREACGTSGMKAALNGVPQLGTLDGWWIEGHLEGVTGWRIGGEPGEETDDAYGKDSADLYEKLEESIIPCFYADRKDWVQVMRNSIAFNASYFNSHRMVKEYLLNAYF